MKDWLCFTKGTVSVLLLLLLYSGQLNANPGKNKKAKADYKEHVNAAKRSGVRLLETNRQLNKLVKQKKLTTVTNGRGFVVTKLAYSKPVLTPKANKVLKGIGNNFYTKSKKGNFAVTSITRTLQDQRKLRRVNGNATKNVSSHNYGCSFDISYIRFNKKKAANQKLENTLDKTLNQYQDGGKLYYIKEKKEHCYHVTVRNK
jgi:hypothetical protein